MPLASQIKGVRYLFNNNNDIDFCFRLRAKGYKIICTPNAKLYHYESASRKSDIKNSYKVIEAFNHLIIQVFKQLNIQSSGFNSKKIQRYRQFLRERAYFRGKWECRAGISPE